MSLEQELQEQFSVEVRDEGIALFKSKKVAPLSESHKHATFELQVDSPEQTSLEYLEDMNDFSMQCTCSKYENGEYCEHLWASVLAADQKKLFPEIARPEVVTLTSPSESTTDGVSSWKDYVLRAQNAGRVLKPDDRNKRKKGSFTPLQRTGFYAIDLQGSLSLKKIKMHFFMKEHLANGAFTGMKIASVDQQSLRLYPDPHDQDILIQLLGKTQPYSSFSMNQRTETVLISPAYAEPILRSLAEADKLFILRDKKELTPQKYYVPQIEKWDFFPESWNLQLILNQFEDFYFLNARLTNGKETKKIKDISGSIEQFVFFPYGMVTSDLSEHGTWIEIFSRRKEIEIPKNEVDSFLELYFTDPKAPQLILPSELQFSDIEGIVPEVQLSFSATKGTSLLSSQVEFVYAGQKIRPHLSSTFLTDIKKKQKIHRNFDLEKKVLEKFQEFKPFPVPMKNGSGHAGTGYFSDGLFRKVVFQSIELGWKVVAHQKTVQKAQDFQLSLKSGVDWFDVQLEVEFGDQKVYFPQLLQSLKAGEKLITLGDGTFGLLPEEWLQQFRTLGDLAQVTKEGIRLNRIQALFFSANLEKNGRFNSDQSFQDLRKIIDNLKDLKPQKTSKKFKGDLRLYQELGLSWLSILSQNQIGGVLADDMGLGKTIQVLALLSKELESKEKHLPSLIIMPKSLIFNWQDEIKKFTPHFKVIDYTGIKRHDNTDQLAKADVVLTTYQTLRVDVEKLQNQKFKFLILDEAHTIKNAASQSAMACRLIQAEKKLALTGTPVENSLNDLFSILEVVNPGLITTSQANKWVKEKDPEVLRSLGKALSPFLLRRTKEEVLKDLPQKTEQILYCELSPEEKKKYEELKAFYWNNLTGKIREKGLEKSKIEVLEALLRLRQASCHQGLLNKDMRMQSSSKFDVLLEHLDSILKENHKALIFSQFTSLLALLQNQLQERGIAYEYLDGQTKNRQERVENFQSNPNVKLFLLSLKAGGVGLNLTSADYVFILDPWWNPAAESQAIDRTHRIGQTKSVFAYKIIAKDTVEEKILELQNAKKSLAKSVISDEKSLLKSLKMEDLHALFT